MLKIHFFEDVLKKFASVFFRVSIVLLGFYLCSVLPNPFETWHYVIFTLTYIIVIVYFYKHPKYPKLRMTTDFLYIIAVVYGKSLSSPLVVMYLLLPIINSPNHTGGKRGISPYVYTLLAISVVGDYIDALRLVPLFFAFATIGLFQYVAYRITRFNTYLANVLDEAYYNNIELNKTHHIYKHIIKAINSSSILSRLITLQGMYCLVLKSQTVYIVNTSSFVLKCEFDDKDDLLTKINNSSIITNVKVKMDGRYINNNICLRVKSKHNLYLFILDFGDKEVGFFTTIVAEYILKVICVRIVKVLEIEHKINEMKKEYVEKYNSNAEYLESAANAMHFIKNKFSPFKTLIRLLNEPAETQLTLKEITATALRRSVTSLGAIEEKATKMLQARNGLMYREIEPHSVQKLFTVFRRVWVDHFTDEPFTIKWDKQCLDKTITVNLEGIYLVFSNICDNVYKYNNSEYGVEFDEKDGAVTILFYNNFKEHRSNIKLLCSEFMSDDTQEIASRKTLGLETIKKVAHQMHISCEMFLDNDKSLLCFRLSFAEVEND